MDGCIGLDFGPFALRDREPNRKEPATPKHAVFECDNPDDFFFLIGDSPKNGIEITAEMWFIHQCSFERDDRGAKKIHVFIGLAANYERVLIHHVRKANLSPVSGGLPSYALLPLGMDVDLASMCNGESTHVHCI
jgi:hypothetical protein